MSKLLKGTSLRFLEYYLCAYHTHLLYTHLLYTLELPKSTRILRIPAFSIKAREALSQYIARPPIALKKLIFQQIGDGTLIFYTPDNEFFNGKIKIFTALQFMAEATQHILQMAIGILIIVAVLIDRRTRNEDRKEGDNNRSRRRGSCKNFPRDQRDNRRVRLATLMEYVVFAVTRWRWMATLVLFGVCR